MKVTLTAQEIIAKFGLLADTELVIEQSKNEWISNIGRDSYGPPDSLPIDTEIEVKYRSGDTGTGRALEWTISWNEKFGSIFSIVAYRVI